MIAAGHPDGVRGVWDSDDCDDEAPEWFLEAVGQEPRVRAVAFEGAELEVLEWGPDDAPGIHFLHGFRAHAGWWRHIAPLLGDRYHCVASSWSGMGRSAMREAYSLASYAHEAMAVGEAAGLYRVQARPMVVAHSLGGHVAALMAEQYGDRLAGALLLDASIRPTPIRAPEDPPRRVFASPEDAAARFRLTPAQPAEPYVMDFIARGSVTPAAGGEGWEWCFDPLISRKLERTHCWDAIARARCPLAFVRGEESRVVSAGLEAAQREGAPEGTPFFTMPAAGHHLMMDQPIAVATAIHAFAAQWLMQS